MNLNPNSAWTEAKVEQYLQQATIPMRISCNDSDGYPVVCSLWFMYENDMLWSASHKNSYLIKVLQNNQRIGFEVGSNDYPYHGVRGKADVSLLDGDPNNVLGQVIDKYLQGSNENLANWLLSRKEDEYAIQISPVSINSWDFSQRMSK